MCLRGQRSLAILRALPGCGLMLARIGNEWSVFVIALFGAA